MSTPKVEVVTAWYNEEILAPFFLNHYRYADKIHILFDLATNDETMRFLDDRKDIAIHPISYPKGIDWEVKSGAVNKIANSLDCDWVIAVDSDEFIWPKGRIDGTKEWLAEQQGNVVLAAMYAVYRHKDDEDLDISNPSAMQRKHGDAKIGQTYGIDGWIKPCVVKPEVQIEWSCGVHMANDNPRMRINSEFMIGAHWAMADPSIAISRRLAQKERQSERNKQLGHGFQNWDVTRDQILAECELHNNDPQIFL